MDQEELKSVTGTVFNVQHYSIHDGPGIRTNVFVKGCPLRCLWCSNPESQLPEPQLMYLEDKCTGCGACIAACPQNAVSRQPDRPDKVRTDRALCTACGACVEGCPTEARTISGETMTAHDAYLQVEEDRLFYRECCTKSLDNLMDALDAERRNLNVLGDTDIPHLTDIIRDWYAHQGAEGNTISELQHSLPHFGYSPMPKTMDYRYITEDVPFGLIPSVEFFKQFGFEYTVHKALVDVICAVCKRDFYKEARTMEQLGIAGMDREQLIRYLETGK